MSPRGVAIYTTGDYGSTVNVIDPGKGPLRLRFTQANGKQTDRSLRHRDERRAKAQARELAQQLRARRATDSGAPGARTDITVGEVFARYTTQVSVHKKGDQPREDARRRTLWLAFLGPERRARLVTPADVRAFTAQRASGTLVVDGLDLKAVVKPRTVDADIVYLLSVFNWAYNEARLLSENPLRGTARPAVVSQLRPMADPARVAQLLEVAPRVHPRFALLLTCVRYLGWRVSAICAIDGFDIDRAVSPLAPYGTLRKNWQHDKEGVGQVVPMPRAVREAFDAAGVGGAGPVFSSARNPKTAMSRYHARDLLERAERLAGLAPIEGGDWHPYRRLWATERKGLPKKDVMVGGGWQDERSLEKYQLADPATLKQVMLFEPGASETTSDTPDMQTAAGLGVKPGTQRPTSSRAGGRASA